MSAEVTENYPTSSGLILYFDTDSTEGLLDELGEAFDVNTIAGALHVAPSLIVVRQPVWDLLESELQKRIKERYKVKDVKRSYTPLETPSGRALHRGWPALIYRARPIVAIAGENIVADWVGANG